MNTTNTQIEVADDRDCFPIANLPVANLPSNISRRSALTRSTALAGAGIGAGMGLFGAGHANAQPTPPSDSGDWTKDSLIGARIHAERIRLVDLGGGKQQITNWIYTKESSFGGPGVTHFSLRIYVTKDTYSVSSSGLWKFLISERQLRFKIHRTASASASDNSLKGYEVVGDKYHIKTVLSGKQLIPDATCARHHRRLAAKPRAMILMALLKSAYDMVPMDSIEWGGVEVAPGQPAADIAMLVDFEFMYQAIVDGILYPAGAYVIYFITKVDGTIRRTPPIKKNAASKDLVEIFRNLAVAKRDIGKGLDMMFNMKIAGFTSGGVAAATTTMAILEMDTNRTRIFPQIAIGASLVMITSGAAYYSGSSMYSYALTSWNTLVPTLLPTGAIMVTCTDAFGAFKSGLASIPPEMVGCPTGDGFDRTEL